MNYCLVLLNIAFILLRPSFTGPLIPISIPVRAETNSSSNVSGSASLPSPGSTSRRELSTAETHSYNITLETNHYVHMVVQQFGLDAVVTLYDPTGRVLMTVQCRSYAPTPISIVAEKSGAYRLELRSLEKNETRGHYELQTVDVRPATSGDHPRLAAEKAVAEAEQLLRDWNANSNREAIDKFKQSLPLWKSVADHREEAIALRRIGNIHQELGDYQNALAFYEQSLSVSRTFKNRLGESEALSEIGYVNISLGQKRRALENCTKALLLSQKAGDRRTEAKAINNLGEVHNWSGELQTALGYYRRALDLWTSLEDRRGQAETHTYLGYAYSDLGHGREAFDSYNKSLSLWQAVSDRRGQGITLTAIGRLYSRIGESQAALDFFQRAMRFIQPLGDPFEEASILNGIAYVHDQLGEKRKAIEYYEQALPRFRAIGFSNAYAMTVYDVARAHYALGDNKRALECYQQALAISKSSGDRRLESMELREIGKIYDSMGDKSKALVHYQKALSFWTDADFREKADTLTPIGRIYEGFGEKQKALQYYEKALSFSRKADFRVGEAATLQNIARVERDRGNLKAALARAEEALGVVESLRGKVNSQDLRTSYFSSVRQQYEFYIDLLMLLDRERPNEGFKGAAFEASERGRARSFLETLSVARVGVRNNADPVLLERESSLSKDLNEKAARRMRFQGGARQDPAEDAALAKEIDELAWQLREVEAQIRTASMRETASLETRPLSLPAIQERVLEDNTLLLEYSLGDERSYLWAITKNSVHSYELPKRAEIEVTARNVYTLLTASQPLAGETFEQRQSRVMTANEQLPALITNLSRMVLEPVASELGNKRLLIVADGALQYIPFQVLSKPADPNPLGLNATATQARPLVADHEIVNEPSASALALLIEGTASRKQPANSVAVFADPVFEADDPRIKSGNSTNSEVLTSELNETELHRALRDVNFTGSDSRIPRLPASRDEADAIIAAAPWWSDFKAIGFDANRETALSADLGDYRIVHFATHGFLNDEHPELSGVVLSLFDEKGQPREGFLRLHDIYNLKLPVELVVLSACNTGLGKDVRGEGLIGLTRGFMYAGASSVVASLWKVDDEATAELMRHFYTAMLQDGLEPPAALRKAQLQMSTQKRWQSPYYWSGFIIQGQYVQRAGPPPLFSPSVYVWVGAIAVALLFAIFFGWRKRRSRFV